jgi:hypothetical protein
MKNLIFLAPLLALAACIPVAQTGPGYPVTGPGYGPPRPPVGPVYNNSTDPHRKAYEDGFMFGRRDARNGKQANYMLYNTQYNAATKKDFGQGYMNGYRSYRPR